jgi:hypothetical protein
MGFQGFTVVPITIAETDKRIERLTRKFDSDKSKYTDLGAFGAWGVTLAFNGA